MKICPKCQQTYTDENLNFCLNDGAVLTQSGGSTANGDALPETVFVNQPRPTNPNQPFGNQQQFGNQQYGTWNNPNQPPQPQFSMQPQAKSSKSWVWVVGILGFLVLLCGGGGLLGYFALREVGDNIVVSNNNSKPKVSPTVASNVTRYDMTLWNPDVGEFATTTYADNKFTVEVTKPNYYYVVITQPNATTKAEHETQNVTTRVTVVNRLAKAVKYGFGLVVHSDTTPLNQDYAFVIDSENKKYRILRHSFKEEKVLTGWTSSSAIKSGTAENVLEVRDNGGLMNFFINGQFIKAVDDENNNTDGIAGIYSSDSIPIDFSNLEIEKK
jgi:hypothetical protein